MITSITTGDYQDSTVIIASPSVGNVSQLSMDLVISTLKPKLIGSIWHESVLPLIGYDPYDSESNSLCTGADVYHSPELKLILMQMRAPLQVDKSRQNDFLQSLIEYFKSLNVASIVVLAGLFAHKRDDTEMLEGSFRFITSPQAQDAYGSGLEPLNWKRMRGNEFKNNFSCPSLSGAGFSRRLFNICVNKEVPCVILLYFCLEGDNINDAVVFTKITNEWLKIIPGNDFVYPPSWKFLFGSSIPYGMF